MNKEKYYINIADGEISKSSTASPWNFEIEASPQEVSKLREMFNQMDSANLQSYVRAHIPFDEYHHDNANDHYDEGIRKVYQMIYQLGNSEAKQHIEQMGIINSGQDHL